MPCPPPGPQSPWRSWYLFPEAAAHPGGPCWPRLSNRWVAVPSRGPAEKGRSGIGKGDRLFQVLLLKDALCTSDQGRTGMAPWEVGGSVAAHQTEACEVLGTVPIVCMGFTVTRRQFRAGYERGKCNLLGRRGLPFSRARRRQKDQW